MRDIRFPIDAAELLTYFESISRSSSDTHWRNGAEMCRRWLALMAQPATQGDIDLFLARLESEPNPGSGWTDLGMRFRHWARARGFRT